MLASSYVLERERFNAQFHLLYLLRKFNLVNFQLFVQTIQKLQIKLNLTQK